MWGSEKTKKYEKTFKIRLTPMGIDSIKDKDKSFVKDSQVPGEIIAETRCRTPVST
jgi:hypothetical protein